MYPLCYWNKYCEPDQTMAQIRVWMMVIISMNNTWIWDHTTVILVRRNDSIIGICSYSMYLYQFFPMLLQQRVFIYVFSTQMVYGSEKITRVVHSHTFPDGWAQFFQQCRLTGELFPLYLTVKKPQCVFPTATRCEYCQVHIRNTTCLKREK